MRWTIHTRVVDNFGDIGFSWRLAAALAARGDAVRLAVDDRSALAWLAPDGAAGITVTDFDEGEGPGGTPDVIVETFGAGIPDGALAAAAAAPRLPLRIDVEHLSAEPYTLRSHGLRSPHRLADGREFPTWFFFPGFVEGSGGLLREPGLLEARAGFEREPWLARRGTARNAGERVVSLFGYEQPLLSTLVDTLAATPTLMLLSPSTGRSAALTHFGALPAGTPLRSHALPFLSQGGFDHLLWSSDIALVRGEDSLVRAIWAGVPFLWQLYPQDDGAHAAKLAAFLEVYLDGAGADLAADLRAAFSAWNGVGAVDAWPAARFAPGPRFDAWSRHAAAACARFAAVPDLVSQLAGFAAAHG